MLLKLQWLFPSDRLRHFLLQTEVGDKHASVVHTQFCRKIILLKITLQWQGSAVN